MKALALLFTMATAANAVDPATFRRGATENVEKPGSVSQFFDRQGFAQGRSVVVSPGNRMMFDRHGRYEGRSVQNASSLKFYNRQGITQERLTTTTGAQSSANRSGGGTAVQSGSEVRYYNRRVPIKGRDDQRPGTAYLFDHQGRYLGRSRTVKP